MSEIKISVILPCYNVEKYIRRGLDSVLAQTLQEWEANLVDDGATDSTGRICDEYAEKDRRFKVVHTENLGVSCARNAGMKETKGELLYFMDPDDWIEPDCFERCYNIYRNNDCDIIQFEKYWVYGNEKHTDIEKQSGIKNHEQIIREYSGPMSGLGQNALNAWYNGENLWNYKRNLGVWCFMFRRSYIESNHLRFMEGVSMYEDVLFAIEATYHADKLVGITDPLYNYDVRENGAVVTRTNISSTLFNDKWNLIAQRARLRKMVKEFDLHDYYLGSQVLSCLELALKTSDELRNYKQFRKYVCHLAIQESIRKVSIKNAPLKFSVPVRMLKTHCHLLLFIGCWLLHKIGLSQRFTM